MAPALQAFLAATLLTTSVLADEACEGSSNTLVKSVASQYSECLVACPAVCQPAEEVFPAYVNAEQGKGLETALPLLCRDLAPWLCIIEGQRASCDSMITGVAAFGIVLPDNKTAAEAMCAAIATTTTATTTTPKSPVQDGTTANTTTPKSSVQDNETATACEGSQDAFVTLAAAEYPECFHACPAVCPKAEEVFPAYFAAEEGKGREVAGALICRDLDTWMCVVETQKETCARMISGAASMGIALPQSKAAAEAECALLPTTTTSTVPFMSEEDQASQSVRSTDATLTRCLLTALAALALISTSD
eukprot:TRINITY_DN10014_c0_g1_i2.p1 TRINITY_DN10014_c0_g1~~TRINITY_DN10014_c0_g1_i2.p1  ORF type:complete len:341 (+),score=38.10 TRINITY_DN10014_c0_g1_i2:107-1024(+)